MKALAISVTLAAALGCSSKRLPECDAFQATVDKIAKCKTLPEDQRADIAKQAKTMREMFDAIDQAGGIDKAPDDLKGQLRDMCKTQNSTIVEMYSKVAPDCLK